MLIIGSHTNFGPKQILGCVKQTINYEANSFMFYTGAPQNSIRKSIDPEITKEAHKLMNEHNINPDHVICHAAYIINLANKETQSKWDFSIDFLIQEVNRCRSLGVKFIIIHPGSYVNHSKEEGIANIIEALNIVCNSTTDVCILLETMAGKGTEIGSTFEEIKAIIDGVNTTNQLGVCFDTCHTFDAGYDISDFNSILDEFDQKIGLKHLKCLHINDSKNSFQSRKDRHANLGFGQIGFQKLIDIIYNPRIEAVPKILETPWVKDNDNNFPPYKYEIAMIKSKTFQEDLIKTIIKYQGL